MDLSILIPARNEMFLAQTVQDILDNMQGETEIIIVCDGNWPEPPIRDHPRVSIIYHSQSIGQRAATNEAAKMSTAKFIMKCDAHCAFDEGFDVKLMKTFEYDWTVIPRMYNLHAFDWECQSCKNRVYQGPKPVKCEKCLKAAEFERFIVWKPRRNCRSDFMRFDSELHFQYWKEFEKREESKGDFAPTMSLLGACWMLHRERYWEIEGMDEAHGSWGQMGTELACKTWLSGGQLLVNKTTWFSHLFRTQPGFGFPYPNPGIQAARNRSRELWFNDSWHLQKYPLHWMLRKFAPIPGWEEEQIANLERTSTFGKSGSTEHAVVPEIKDEASSSFFESVAIDEAVVEEQPNPFVEEEPDLTNAEEYEVIPPEELAMDEPPPNLDEEEEEPEQPAQVIQPPQPKEVAQVEQEEQILPPCDLDAIQSQTVIIAAPMLDLDEVIEVSEDEAAVLPDSRIEAMPNPETGEMEKVPTATPIKQLGTVKGCVYYTDNNIDDLIMVAVQRQLSTAASGMEIISVSLKPMFFGKNFLFNGERGHLTMFQQILRGLEESTADIVFLTEHDILYHPSHFEFVPPQDNIFYYNENTWKVDAYEGKAVFYYTKQTSGCCAYRNLLLEHYKTRVRRVAKDGFTRAMGFEPGCHQYPRGVDKYTAERWMSSVPNIDIRHKNNLTQSRWSQDQFRSKRSCQGWTLSDEVPGWGVTKGKFPELLAALANPHQQIS